MNKFRALWAKVPKIVKSSLENVALAGVGGAVVAYQAGGTLEAIGGAAISAAIAAVYSLIARFRGDPNVASLVK